jgi:large subunit ribosomal protein L3
MKAIIGRKLGMTRIYDDSGRVIPVTVIEAGPCPVVQVRTFEDGRRAVQLGLGSRKPKHTTKAEAGHARGASLDAAPFVLQEFSMEAGDADLSAGAVVTVTAFAEGDQVKVTGTTKGKGFQGVVRRHGFRGGPASHGNTRYRRPGSAGPGTDPSRVIKGKRLPGQMGSARHTQLGLRVVRIDPERNLLYIRGSVPGAARSVVTVKHQVGRSRYA